jgi:hypothetical protein
MKRLTWWFLCAPLAVTAAFGACSSNGEHNVSTGGGGTASGTGGVSSSSTGGGAPASGGAGGGPIDAGTDATWDGGMPFDCGGCTCDGTTHMCLGVYGAGAPPPPPYGIDCNADGGVSGCVPIPQECLPAPTCACIKAHSTYCGICSVHDGGFHIDCPAP